MANYRAHVNTKHTNITLFENTSTFQGVCWLPMHKFVKKCWTSIISLYFTHFCNIFIAWNCILIYLRTYLKNYIKMYYCATKLSLKMAVNGWSTWKKYKEIINGSKFRCSSEIQQYTSWMTKLDVPIKPTKKNTVSNRRYSQTKICGKVKIEIKSRNDLLSMHKLDYPLRILSSE